MIWIPSFDDSASDYDDRPALAASGDCFHCISFALFRLEQLGKYDWRQDWKAILVYSAVVFACTQAVYLISKHLYGEAGSIHIEVFAAAFVLGMVMKHKEHDTPAERKFHGDFFPLYVSGWNEHATFLGVDFAEASLGQHSVRVRRR